MKNSVPTIRNGNNTAHTSHPIRSRMKCLFAAATATLLVSGCAEKSPSIQRPYSSVEPFWERDGRNATRPPITASVLSPARRSFRGATQTSTPPST